MPYAAPGSPLRRIGIAALVATGFALGIYALLSAVGGGGLVSFAFLVVLPAALCAFLAYARDPMGTASIGRYLAVPLWLVLGAVAVGAVVLREGVLCVLMLAPIWLVSGMAGAVVTYKLRRRIDDGRLYSSGALVLPVIAMLVEPLVPLPIADVEVSRSITVAATPERIWPLLRGIPDVRPGEGRWNLSQDVVGVPKPLGATLVRGGLGAERLARWTNGIAFRERITEWRPGRRIGWRFVFDDVAAWAFTDRHLVPDSTYFRVTTGGYTLTPLAGGGTRVTLDTRYRIATPVNAYARLWGELFLGDLEDNLLHIIRGRAEQGADPG